MTGTMHTRPVHDEQQHSVGELVGQATEQLSRLVRQEVALAKMELAEKGKRAGRGGGMLGAAGAIAYVGLFALAGNGHRRALAGAARLGRGAHRDGGALRDRGRTGHDGPCPAPPRRAPKPEETLGSVRADVDQIRERAHR